MRGQLLDLFCGKVIFSQYPLDERTAGVLPLELALSVGEPSSSAMDMPEIARVADDLQPKLLTYRLKSRANVTTPKLDFNSLSGPTRELARNMAMSIVGDTELQRQIIPLLEQRDRGLRVDRTLLLECIVIEAVLAACHESNGDSVSVIELTKAVNTILRGRGEVLEVSPEKVGWKMRALGLNTEFVAHGRKGLRLSIATRSTVHQLARSFGVRTMQVGSTYGNCVQCAAANTRSDDDGKH